MSTKFRPITHIITNNTTRPLSIFEVVPDPVFRYQTKQYGNYIWTVENIAETDGGSGIFPIDYSQWNPLYNYTYPTVYYYSLEAANRIVSRYSDLGWRIPSPTDWTNLTNYIGSKPGTKMKTTLGWSNTNGTNESGFNAYAYGFIKDDGTVTSTPGVSRYGIGCECCFWVSSNQELVLDKSLTSAKVRNKYDSWRIYSLRLVKDA